MKIMGLMTFVHYSRNDMLDDAVDNAKHINESNIATSALKQGLESPPSGGKVSRERDR